MSDKFNAAPAPAAVAVPEQSHDCCNSWFMSLSEGRQAVLRDDKWMLAHAAFDAGRAALAAAPAQAVPTDERQRMTAGRASFFMERFLKEEKLLGPNEQAALHFVIDMLAAPAQAVAVPADEPYRYFWEQFIHMDNGPGWQDVYREYDPRLPENRAYHDCDFGDPTEVRNFTPLYLAAPAQEHARLDKPARVGHGTFGIGVQTRLVVEAAQRAFETEVRIQALTPEQRVEQERNRRALWDMIHGPLSAPAQEHATTGPEKWIDDPHDIEQGMMLNPEWVHAQEHATQLAGQALPRRQWTDGTRTLKQDVLSAIHDYSRTKPEDDPEDPESWESWFEAAFDLLGTRVSDIFDEHAAPAQAQEDAARLDAMQAQRIAVIPEFEGPWDATIYGDSDEPIISASGNTPREAIDAARAAQGGRDA